MREGGLRSSFKPINLHRVHDLLGHEGTEETEAKEEEEEEERGAAAM